MQINKPGRGDKNRRNDALGSSHQEAAQHYSALLQDLAVPPRYAIAVSGGSDSMALAVLAAEHKRMARGAVEVLALSVDHGLRDESADEAQTVKKWCEALGLSCQVLTWRGAKPTSGVQAAARAARYRLLYEAAREAGYDALLTAHTEDDQAETVFMRLARGAGPFGLRAIAPVGAFAIGAGAPMTLARPFLDFNRNDLRKVLHSAGQEYLNDPSNDNPAFERVRLRAVLKQLQTQGAVSQRALARSAKEARAASDLIIRREQEAFARAGGVFLRWGAACINQAALSALGVAGKGLEKADAVFLLRQLIFAVAGSENPPARTAVEDLMTQLEQTHFKKEHASASLGGAIIAPYGGKLWIYREPAALLGRAGVVPMPGLRIAPHNAALWDRRFIVVNRTAHFIEVKPLGAGQGGQSGESANPALMVNDGAPRAAIQSVPAISAPDGALVASPLGPYMKGGDFRFLGEERFLRRVRRFSPSD